MMGEEEDIQQICKELDHLTIRTLELTEEFIRCKAKLEKTMKFGFINIAKARYIMGNNTISSLQLPNENSTEFNALTTVILSTSDDNGYKKFNLNCNSKSKDEETFEEDEDNIRRRTKDQTKTGIDSLTDETEMQLRPINNTSTMDPIKWFGVLVPQNLRQAQSSFKTVIELTAENASVQLELEATRNKYIELKEKRAVLLKTSTSN